MTRTTTRVRIRFHPRSDRFALAQLVAPMLNLRPEAVAQRLAQDAVLIGPLPRAEAEALTEALSSFGVDARLETDRRYDPSGRPLPHAG
jgi:hypothetical protein